MKASLTPCSKIAKEITGKQQSRCCHFLKRRWFVDVIGCPLLCEALSDPCSSVVISCPGVTPSCRCSELVPEQVSQCVPSSRVTPRDFSWPPHSLPTIWAPSGGGLCHHAPKWSYTLKRGWGSTSIQTSHVFQVWI